MELWLALGALWGFECLGFFPHGAAHVELRRRDAQLALRAGLAWTSLWPGRCTAVLDGIPFEVTSQRVAARGALSLYAATAGMDEERVLAFGTLAPEALGATVRTSAGPLLRAHSDVAAERIAGWVAEMEHTPADERAAAFLALWRRALDPAPVKDAAARVRRATLAHRVLAGIAFVGALAGVPALAVVTGHGFGAAWDVAWAPLLALHSAGWLALLGAELRLRAPGRGMRLFRTLLYPPSLWRASVDLASAALGAHHPLAVAVALRQPDANEPLARRALAECRWPAFDRRGGEAAPDLLERRAAALARADVIEALFAAAGLLSARLASPPQPRTPHAASYCPVCQSEFVVGGWTCPDCRIEAKPFP